jgi:hypothetical protein
MSEHEPDRPGVESGAGPRVKRLWLAPEITELPRLTELTLQTGSPIGGSGSTGGGGSTVF